MSPLFPQLSFTSMVQMAKRCVQQEMRGTFYCGHPSLWEMRYADPSIGWPVQPRTLFLYRYRLDFDELGLHLQGLAQLCPDCLTLYYSIQEIRKQSA